MNISAPSTIMTINHQWRGILTAITIACVTYITWRLKLWICHREVATETESFSRGRHIEYTLWIPSFPMGWMRRFHSLVSYELNIILYDLLYVKNLLHEWGDFICLFLMNWTELVFAFCLLLYFYNVSWIYVICL